MKKLIQYAAGLGVGFLAVQVLDGTPFNHWMVHLPIFVSAMYATAVAQHYWDHWRARASVSRFGARDSGT